MARTIEDIKKSMGNRLINNSVIQAIYQLSPGKTFEEEFSASSVESILLYAVAYGIHVHEVLFDEHKAEVVDYIANMKPHSLRWYANMAKSYQHGHNLPADSDKYDNTGVTDEVIESSKIVKYAAVTEQDRGLRIKVATDDADDLGPLDGAQLSAFTDYMERIKDAGVKLTITSGIADSLQLNLYVKYDPLILDNTGKRLDGSDPDPVQTAVKEYLKNLPFNGRLELSALIDEIQKVEGVMAPYITGAKKKYGSLPFTSFTNQVYTPDSGYLRIVDPVNDLVINFEPNE